MNNIEILEEFIKHYKEVQEKYKDDEIQAEIERSCYFEEVPAEAIENLIQENKELKEKVKGMYDKSNKLIEVTNLYLNSIPKSKVKELAKKYEFALNGYDSSTADYIHSQNLGKYLACVELLEEGE